MRVSTEDLTKLPLQPVAPHGVSNPPWGAQAEPTLGKPGGQNTDGEAGALGPAPPTRHVTERGGALKWLDQGMSCQRPFCRRRAKTARPPRVLMRLRKPWTRRRLRLDVVLRCFFIPPPASQAAECGLAKVDEK